MKSTMPILLFIVCAWLPGHAQTSGYLILSKQGTGSITNDAVSLTLTSGPNCDETQTRIPDGSRMVSDHFVMTVGANGTGVFYGTVRILAPTGEILHVGTLRGTVGTNDCDPANGGACAAVCTRPGHLEGLFEPVPTFAPNPNGEIAMLHFKADLERDSDVQEALYRFRLNGLFAPLPVENPNIQLTPDKLRYAQEEPIRVAIVNKSEKTIRGSGPRSANCTILELERQENGQWTPHQTICPKLYFEKDVQPGETATVEFRLSAGGAPIQPGIFRLLLPYRVVDGGVVAPKEQIVISPLFQVGEVARRRIERSR
jgi:hypothetical protein